MSTIDPQSAPTEATSKAQRHRSIPLWAAFVALLLTAVVSLTAGLLLKSNPTTAARPTTPAAVNVGSGKVVPASPVQYDFFARYRHTPGYIGKIATAHLEAGKTYYLPGNTSLVQTGNHEWFIQDVDAAVLSNIKDAGPHPYTVNIATEPPRYMFLGGSGLEITLPDRPDFVHAQGENGPVWIKVLNPPAHDLRDPSFRHQTVIPVTSVTPAPGYQLEDYYPEMKRVSSLPVGQQASILTSIVKLVSDGTHGYAEDWAALPTSTTLRHARLMTITHTKHGFVVCPRDTVDRKQMELYTTPDNYVPLHTEIKVKVAC